MAGELPSFEAEKTGRAEGASSMSAARQALLGGPEARQRLAEADAKTLSEEPKRGGPGYFLAVFIFLWISLPWSGSIFDRRSLVWFLPWACFAALLWYRSGSDIDLSGPYSYSRDGDGDEAQDDPGFDRAEIAGDTAEIADEVSPATLVPDAAWNPPPGIWVKPRGDWGFTDTIDGELAGPFEVQIEESGATLFDGRRGWRGRIRSARHKYGFMEFVMRPRHAPFDGLVSIDVTNGGHSIYSGVADTRGLECDWL